MNLTDRRLKMQLKTLQRELRKGEFWQLLYFFSMHTSVFFTTAVLTDLFILDNHLGKFS